MLRRAVLTLFVLSGVVSGSWAARIPDVGERVGATPATLGSALFCLSLGALLGMQVAGGFCARRGAGLVGVAGGAALAATAVLPGLVTSLPWLGAVLIVFGALTGGLNVAANSLGVELERRLHRPVMSSLHAGFSFGGLGGALSGAAAGGLPVALHLALVGVAGLLATAMAAPVLLAADRNKRTPAPTVPAPAGSAPAGSVTAGSVTVSPLRTVVVLLGVIAGCTAVAEGSITDWGALHLRDLQAGPALAAAGYAGFSLAMGLGRLGGRRWVIRYGDTRVLVGGTAVAAVGLVAAALTRFPPAAIAGFVLVGLGLANVFPLAVAKAGVVGGPRGVARASVVGYSGLLGGPPVIGFLADRIGLAAALACVSVLVLAAGLLALVVGAELPAAATVASRLRARLAPIAAGAGSVARRQAADVRSLATPTRRAAPGRPR